MPFRPSRWLRATALAVLVPAGIAAQAPALNHVYAYVDAAAYDAMAASPWLRDSLATVREAEVSDGTQRWKALYIFGRQTYLELYRAGPGTPPAGTVAIALGSDTRTGFADVRDRWRQAATVSETSRTRVNGTDTIPWFDQVEVPLPALVRLWLMAYDARHNARRWPADPSIAGRVDRRSYLRSVSDTTRPLADLAHLRLALPGDAQSPLVRLLVTSGMTRHQFTDSLVLRGNGFSIALVAPQAGESPGLVAAEWSLGGPAPPGTVGSRGFAVSISGDRATFSRARRCPLVHRMVTVAASDLATCQGGAGQAIVVFESGLGEGLDAWGTVLDSVATFARVVSYDRAGTHGSTSADSTTVDTRIRDLEGLIRATGAESVILVGHSLGGALVQALAARLPQRVAGLVLVDPTPIGFFDMQREIVGDAQFRANRARQDGIMRGAIRSDWLQISETLAAGQPLSASAERPVVLLTAGRIQNPDTLVGARVKAAWIDLHRELARRLNATHHVIPRSGHHIQHEDPSAVVDAIRRLVLQRTPQ